MKLKRNLEPTDFLDSEVRVTPWIDFGDHGMRAYRIWVCRCNIGWFQRHEWIAYGANQSEIEPWIKACKGFGRNMVVSEDGTESDPQPDLLSFTANLRSFPEKYKPGDVYYTFISL